jgi:DHA1 family tetracycline resistance protein-like MFS transporter
MLPLSLSGGILNTVISSSLTKSVTPMEIGGTLGLSASLESLTRVISPVLGSLMLERLGTVAPGLFCAGIMAVLASYVWRFILNGQVPVIAQGNVSGLRPERVPLKIED